MLTRAAVTTPGASATRAPLKRERSAHEARADTYDERAKVGVAGTKAETMLKVVRLLIGRTVAKQACAEDGRRCGTAFWRQMLKNGGIFGFIYNAAAGD